MGGQAWFSVVARWRDSDIQSDKLFPLLVAASYGDSGSHLAPQRPNSSKTGASSLPEAVREY